MIISLGLYLGLRSSTTEVAPPPTPPAADAPAPAPEEWPTQEQTAAEVTAVVTQAHPRWKAACWDTADPATRQPGRYISSLAFDASGKLTISGIGEIRDGSDPAIAQCLRMQVNTFTISPPGHPVAYEVPIRMP